MSLIQLIFNWQARLAVWFIATPPPYYFAWFRSIDAIAGAACSRYKYFFLFFPGFPATHTQEATHEDFINLRNIYIFFVITDVLKGVLYERRDEMELCAERRGRRHEKPRWMRRTSHALFMSSSHFDSVKRAWRVRTASCSVSGAASRGAAGADPSRGGRRWRVRRANFCICRVLRARPLSIECTPSRVWFSWVFVEFSRIFVNFREFSR